MFRFVFAQFFFCLLRLLTLFIGATQNLLLIDELENTRYRLPAVDWVQGKAFSLYTVLYSQHTYSRCCFDRQTYHIKSGSYIPV
ncbi:hypothetical protein CYLTODRAFT_278754 [Cylindrobasidium torrendii FP15055 ss-10]|uniref:Secreted protein n=1 Tax=Cylindrobasidium torrendii FP15055 ss-10 TaxID=1314674 RepID=A0A0D7BBH5_9AGAR|nr:hypothetical protein CYLTODRAFT_278754 [Cylindrobasidium torrendii FP15055 ss-10]